MHPLGSSRLESVPVCSDGRGLLVVADIKYPFLGLQVTQACLEGCTVLSNSTCSHMERRYCAPAQGNKHSLAMEIYLGHTYARGLATSTQKEKVPVSVVSLNIF